MKKFITTIVALLLFANVNLFPQNMGMFKQHKKKIRQLEQIKLIEILNLDEDTSARFFARRNKYLDEVDKLVSEKNGLLKEISNKINKGEQVDSKEYRKKLFALEQKILDKRIQYFNSLDDLLTNEQIAKLLVFQRDFRREIMRTFMKEHRGRMKMR